MKQFNYGVSIAVSLEILPHVAWAAAADFRFEAVAGRVERGVDVTIKVQVFERAQNRPVANIEFLDSRIERSTDGVSVASFPAFFVPSVDYGVYGFRTDFPTDGDWTLRLSAKIPGERQSISASVNFKVGGPSLSPNGPGPRLPKTPTVSRR